MVVSAGEEDEVDEADREGYYDEEGAGLEVAAVSDVAGESFEEFVPGTLLLQGNAESRERAGGHDA